MGSFLSSIGKMLGGGDIMQTAMPFLKSTMTENGLSHMVVSLQENGEVKIDMFKIEQGVQVLDGVQLERAKQIMQDLSREKEALQEEVTRLDQEIKELSEQVSFYAATNADLRDQLDKLKEVSNAG